MPSPNTYTGSNRQRRRQPIESEQRTLPELPKQIHRVNFFEKPRRWMLWLIVINMATWIIILPTYIINRAGQLEYMPVVLIGIGLIPLYIIFLYIGRMILYVYWKFFWWFISCQFTCLTIVTIALLLAMASGSFVLSNYVSF